MRTICPVCGQSVAVQLGFIVPHFLKIETGNVEAQKKLAKMAMRCLGSMKRAPKPPATEQET